MSQRATSAREPARELFEGTAVDPQDLVVDLARVYGEAGPSLLARKKASACEDGRWKVGAVRAPPAGWWIPLEWNPKWGKWTRGRYQMQLAWLFGRALEAAEASGKSMPFVLVHDGTFFEQAKYRWRMNPLNAACGGPLSAPSEYFDSEAALDDLERTLAYVSARWGYSPAISGWCLGTRLAANGVDEWHRKVTRVVERVDQSGRALISLNPLVTGFAERGRLGTFERGNVWRVDRERSRRARIDVTRSVASEGSRSLRIHGRFPEEHVWIRRELDENLFGYPLLSFDVFVPPDGPDGMRVQVYLRDGTLLWYEVMTPTMLRRGDWTKVLVPLGGEAPMKPMGHGRPWGDYSRTRVRE